MYCGIKCVHDAIPVCQVDCFPHAQCLPLRAVSAMTLIALTLDLAFRKPNFFQSDFQSVLLLLHFQPDNNNYWLTFVYYYYCYIIILKIFLHIIDILLFSSCKENGCTAAFTTKQCLQFHYKKVHCFSESSMPIIERSVAYTFDAYSGGIVEDPGRGKSPRFDKERRNSTDNNSSSLLSLDDSSTTSSAKADISGTSSAIDGNSGKYPHNYYWCWRFL